MTKRSKTIGWASRVACLATVALAVGTAFAQQQQSDEQRSSGQQSDLPYGLSEDQSTQSQQTRQRGQQSQQRGRQAWQDEQQSQRGEQQYGRERQWNLDQPQYRRGQPSWSRDSQQGSRWMQSDQYGQRGQQAELGVNISQSGQQGVTIIRVRPGTAAEQMGLERGDRITQVNDQQVQSERQFISTIRNMQPGEQVQITIIRDDQEQVLSGELQPRQQSLVLSDPRNQPDDVWQSGYEEERGLGSSEGRTARGSGQSGQISSQRIEELERQVQRLSRQLDELRYTLRDLREQSGLPASRETTARYDEYGSRAVDSTRRQVERRSGDRNRYGQFDASRQRQRQFGIGEQQRSRQSQPGQSGQRGQQGQQSTQSDRYQSDQPSSQSGQSGSQSIEGNQPETPGGEIGSQRQRVGTEDAQQ
jgi:hypothetical protein